MTKGWTWRHAALIVGATLIVVLALQTAGAPPDRIFESLGRSVLAPAGWKNILAKGTPLLAGGLAVFIALRAGLFNIGAEGQMLMGGAAGAAVMLAIPSPVGLILGLAAGCLAGALWALPAGWIRAYRGGHEVISTIMLNWIAKYICDFLAKGPMKDPGQESATSADIAQAAMLPNIITAGPFKLNLAFVLALAALAAAAVWMTKTVSGYELEAAGAGPKAAETAGVPVKKVMLKAMLLSGGLSGLAGGMLVAGLDHRFYSDLAGGMGFDSLGVALLAGSSPWAVLPSALFFSLVDVATSGLSLVGIPKGISGLLLGLVILVFAAVKYGRKRP